MSARKNFGYTLVELMVVLAVMATIATLALVNLKSLNNSQPVTNARKQFITDLRAVQNRVNNGDTSNGKAVSEVALPASGNYYKINGKQVDLVGVTLTTTYGNSPTATALTLCFPDRNLEQYDGVPVGGIAVHSCAGCTAQTTGFVCKGNPAVISSAPVTVKFMSTTGSFNQTVTVDGEGMQITQIN